MSRIDNVMVGQEFPVRVFPGKDGNIISRLPDGRPLLFGQQFLMTPKLRAGHIVQVRVIKPAQTFVLVQPIRLVDESELANQTFDTAPVGSGSDAFVVDSSPMPPVPPFTSFPRKTGGRVDQYIETVTVTNYKCKLCNSVFPQRSVLERHIAEDHNVQYG